MNKSTHNLFFTLRFHFQYWAKRKIDREREGQQEKKNKGWEGKVDKSSSHFPSRHICKHNFKREGRRGNERERGITKRLCVRDHEISERERNERKGRERERERDALFFFLIFYLAMRRNWWRVRERKWDDVCVRDNDNNKTRTERNVPGVKPGLQSPRFNPGVSLRRRNRLHFPIINFTHL